MFDVSVRRTILAAAIPFLASTALPFGADARAPAKAAELVVPVIHYHTADIEGVNVFYVEAGPKDAPAILLLQGFPTSSHMFRNLIPLLADRYHVIAPDYPGFGESDAPDRTKFEYSFAHYATIMDELVEQLGVKRYAMYLFDYGAPVGYRLALKHPERVSALIVQNGNAYEEGLGDFWKPMKVDWANDTPENREALSFLVTLKTTMFQYQDGMEDLTRIDPANWRHDQPLLDRSWQQRYTAGPVSRLWHAMSTLYPQFQAFFRQYKPPTLIVWGKNDKVFPAEGATPYLRDLPHAEFHLLNTGHFALEDQLYVMAPLIHNFLDRKVAKH
jgi:pimeloyl-ACP methyl ester carboxylesterase